jgi:hypothetical protein
MILDNLLMFDLGQNFTGQPAASYNSSNIIDLHQAGLPVLAANQGVRDLGIGDAPALKLLVQVTTAFASAGGATMQVVFQGAADNGAGAPAAFSAYTSSAILASAALTLGARIYDIDIPRPPPAAAIPRFYRLVYVVGTAAFTAGVIESGIVLDRFDQPISTAGVLSGYAPGITIPN